MGLEFPNPDELRSTIFCCCSCLHFPQSTINWESFHTEQGHLPPASSIDWLGCHSNRPGKSCLGTFPVLVMCAHCDITTKSFLIGQTAEALPLRPHPLHTPATLVPVTRKGFWSEDGSCPPVSLLTFSRFNWDDITHPFHTTTHEEAAQWRIGSVSSGEYKNTSRPLQCNQPGKVQ
jgi:hypothetical protein